MKLIFAMCLAVLGLTSTVFSQTPKMSLTIYAPKASNLSEDQNYIPALIQREFVSNISSYSSISVLDWERYEEIHNKLREGHFNEGAQELQDLGNLTPTTHFMTGNITKTASGYALQIQINNTSDKTTTASYSGTFTFADLDNLTGVRRASLDLLPKMGVTLTEQAKTALGGAATTTHVNAQTAMAHGIAAQRSGTEVAALSYFYQAAAFDPSLAEAVGRSSIMAANISSVNIGDNIRNDIVWRRNWVARLKETEETFYKMIMVSDMPYTLFYFTDIQTGNINYKTETADLSIRTNLTANKEWFTALQQALRVAKSVMAELNSTNRKNEWQLTQWPKQGVSNTNPFVRSWRNNLTVEFELVDERGRVIGKQNTILNPSFNINNNFTIEYTANTSSIITFRAIKADDISDNLTIRVVSVNGNSPQATSFAISATSTKNEITHGSFTDHRDGKKYRTIKFSMDSKTWMGENLNYQIDNSRCYENYESNCAKYGRLYTWNAAMRACPTGWHLPTRQEWNDLVAIAGGGSFAGKTLKSKNGWNGTDEFGFSALPAGGRYSIGSYYIIGKYAGWWSANEFGSSNAYYRSMSSYDGIHEGNDNKGFGFSVRCIMD